MGVRAESRDGSRVDPGSTEEGTAKIVILRVQRGILDAVEVPEGVRAVIHDYDADGVIRASCLKMKTTKSSR